MRRDKRQNRMDKDGFKTILYLSGAVVAIALLTFAITYFIYSGKVREEESSIIDATRLVSLAEDSLETESASTQIGKTIEEVKNEVSTNTVANNVINITTGATQNTTNTISNTTKSASSSRTNTTKSQNSAKSEENNVTDKKEEVKRELSFEMPVEGEIMTKYAKDNLVFSETLQEWITHLGIDIKADKTTVVKSAEDGTVDTIKNDPRYGLTVIILHEDGFKTVYSNLLTAEFVTEGEKVTKGQTIGTVGNSAAFEIAEDPHLHFELWKNDENIDPTAYLK